MFYTFTGNTYRNRDLLNSRTGIGAQWSPEHKCWFGYFGGNGMESKFWQLRRAGVKVECHGRGEPAWFSGDDSAEVEAEVEAARESLAGTGFADITDMSAEALSALLGC